MHITRLVSRYSLTTVYKLHMRIWISSLLYPISYRNVSVVWVHISTSLFLLCNDQSYSRNSILKMQKWNTTFLWKCNRTNWLSVSYPYYEKCTLLSILNKCLNIIHLTHTKNRHSTLKTLTNKTKNNNTFYEIFNEISK